MAANRPGKNSIVPSLATVKKPDLNPNRSDPCRFPWHCSHCPRSRARRWTLAAFPCSHTILSHHFETLHLLLIHLRKWLFFRLLDNI